MEACIKLAIDLKGMMKEIPNTHLRSKEAAKKLRKNANVFDRTLIKEWMKSNKMEPVPKATYDVDIQTDKTNTITSTVEMGTQTEAWTLDKFLTLNTLEEVNSLEIWSSCEGRKWDNKLFTNSEIRVGNPLTTEDSVVKVTIVEPHDLNMEKSIQRLFKDKYPELGNLKEEFEVVDQIIKIRTKSPNEIINRKIIKILHNGNDQELWKNKEKLKSETTEDKEVAIHHVTSLAIHHVTSLSTQRLQKMTEAIFHGSRTKVLVYTTKMNTGEEKTKKERDTYGLIIEDKEKTYK